MGGINSGISNALGWGRDGREEILWSEGVGRKGYFKKVVMGPVCTRVQYSWVRGVL